jgi:hypothetical protein
MKIRSLKLLLLSIAFLAVAGFAWSNRGLRDEKVTDTVEPTAGSIELSDAAKSKAAFLEAYTVFMSPRCANCHPAGDTPTQNDAMTLHTQAVTRGKIGMGVYGQKCTTCHQSENLEGAHLPPGTSKPWHMPPADMKMVFQGRSAAQLCRAFKDPKQSDGDRSGRKAIEHVQKRDPLVMWAWEPGNGRSVPPMTFEAFSAKLEEWVANGAVCPD